MARDDRAHGVWYSKRGRGRAHGRGVMRRRRELNGWTRDEFAALLRRLDIRARSGG